MNKILIIAAIIVLSLMLDSCTCNCNRQYSHKMNSKLIEFLEYDDESDVHPFYAVEIKLNTEYSDDIKSKLYGAGLEIESADSKTIIAKAQGEAIRKISKFGFVEFITLLTSNYYPNK